MILALYSVGKPGSQRLAYSVIKATYVSRKQIVTIKLTNY